MSDERPVAVWVLDIIGYDARGGNAHVFSSAERAKATLPGVKWEADGEGWTEVSRPGSVSDVWVIYKAVVDEHTAKAPNGMNIMLMEAIHSTALSCGCGKCLACRASAGDKQALAEVFAAVSAAAMPGEAPSGGER